MDKEFVFIFMYWIYSAEYVCDHRVSAIKAIDLSLIHMLKETEEK